MAGVTFGFGFMEGLITASMVGIVASSATQGTVLNYHFGVPQFATVTIPPVEPGKNYVLDLAKALGPVKAPNGQNVSLPNVAAASVDSQGVFKITINNPTADEFNGSLQLRAIFDDGSYLVMPQRFDANANGEQIINPPSNVAIGSVRWQFVRLIEQDKFRMGTKVLSGPPLEFPANTVRVSPRPNMAAVLTRTGVDFFVGAGKGGGNQSGVPTRPRQSLGWHLPDW